MIKEKSLFLILSILIPLFLLSSSIACPILVREAYYLQIAPLELPERSGYPEEVIREAYDDMLDYCTRGGEGAGRSFHTGQLAWSEAGKGHFDDVERLFHLDFLIAAVTGSFLALFLVLNGITHIRKHRGIRVSRFRKRGPLFWGPVVMAGIFGILAIIAAADYDAFFTGFHHLFFPGKDNWILDYNTDEIIRILPEEVFRNFALMILGLLIAGCVICIVLDFLTGRRSHQGGQEDPCPHKGI